MDYSTLLLAGSFCISLVLLAFGLTAREFARMQLRPARVRAFYDPAGSRARSPWGVR
jgi:hypothetical protein